MQLDHRDMKEISRKRLLELVDTGYAADAVQAARSASEDQLGESDLEAIAAQLIKKKSFALAAELLSAAKDRYASSVGIRDKLVRALYSDGEKVRAKIETDALKDLVQNNEAHLETVYNLYLYTKSYELAETVARAILASAPDRAAIRRSFINTLFTTRSYLKARDQLYLLDRHSTHSEADLMFLAKTLLRLGNEVQQDIRRVENAYLQDKLEREARNRAYLADFQEGDLNLAETFARRVIGLNGDQSFSARVALIEVLLRNNRRKAAISESVECSSLVSKSSQWAILGELWLKLDEKKEALKAAERGIAIHQLTSAWPDTSIRLADIFTACAHPDEARTILTSIDLESIQDIEYVKTFHEACFKVQCNDLALASGKKLLERMPFDQFYKRRVSLLTMTTAQNTDKPALQPEKPAAKGPLRMLRKIFVS